MQIVIDNTYTLEVADYRLAGGHEVLSHGSFMQPNDGVTMFIENIHTDPRPWVAMVRKDADGEFDFKNATRMPLSKSRITRVVR